MQQRFIKFLVLALIFSASAFAVEWTVPLADHRTSLPQRFKVVTASEETGNVLVQIDSNLAIVDKTGAIRFIRELLHLGAAEESIDVFYARARPGGFFVAISEGNGSSSTFTSLMFLTQDGSVKWRYQIASGFERYYDPEPTNLDWWIDGEKLLGFDDDGRTYPINSARLGFKGILRLAEGLNNVLLYSQDALSREATLILCDLNGSLIWRKSLATFDIARMNGEPLFINDAVVIGYEKNDGSQHMQKLALADGSPVWQAKIADPGQTTGFDITSDQDDIFQSIYSATEPFIVRVSGADGQILARRATSAFLSPQQMLPEGWLVLSNSNLNPQWAMLSKSNFSPLWQRPAADQTPKRVSADEVLFVGKLDTNRLVTFSNVDARTGQLVGSINQRSFPGTQSSDIYEASGTSYQVATSTRPAPGVTDSFITAFEHGNGARRYNTRLANFHIDSAAVSGTAIIIADAGLSDPTNSTVRVRRYDPLSETPTYQQTLSFPGEQAVQLHANEQRAVVLLKANCSYTSCANPTQRLVSIEALTGQLAFDIGLPFYPTVLQHSSETLIASSAGRISRISAAGQILWESVGNFGEPLSSTILGLDAPRGRLWVASQQRDLNAPGSARYNLRLQVLDLGTGTPLVTRLINKGALDLPGGLTLLDNGSALLRFQSDFRYPGDDSFHGFLLRLNGNDLSTEFEQLPASTSLFSWKLFGQRFIERENELWLATSRNFGIDRNGQNARSLVSTTTRLNKFTGNLIGEHWWSWTDTSLPKSQTEQWSGIVSPANIFSPMRAEENLLRRSEDFEGGNVDFVVSGPDTFVTDSASTVSFEVTIRNNGPSGSSARLEWLDLSDRAYRVETLSCLPANKCLPVRENGLPSLTLAPASSATVRIKVYGIFAELLSRHEINRIAIAAVPTKEALETTPENNALPIQVRFGPFVDGFEF